MRFVFSPVLLTNAMSLWIITASTSHPAPCFVSVWNQGLPLPPSPHLVLSELSALRILYHSSQAAQPAALCTLSRDPKLLLLWCVHTSHFSCFTQGSEERKESVEMLDMDIRACRDLRESQVSLLLKPDSYTGLEGQDYCSTDHEDGKRAGTSPSPPASE